MNESKFNKKSEKISNFSKPILIEDNQKSNLSIISNSKEKSHSKLNKTQKDYENENKIMKNSILSNLNQDISQDINNSVNNLVRSGKYPPHEDIQPPKSKIENINFPKV